MTISILQSRAISTRIASNLKVLLKGNISIVQSRKLSKAIMEDIALLGGENIGEYLKFPSLADDGQKKRIAEWVSNGADPDTKPAERAILTSSMSPSKLAKLLQKENVTENDVESLKDYKYLILAQPNDADERGFMAHYTADHGVVLVPKDKFILTNIEHAISKFEKKDYSAENFTDTGDDQDTSDYLENIAKQGMPRNEFVSLAKFHIASVKKTDTAQIDKLKSLFNLGDKPSYDDLEKMAGKFLDSKSADRIQRKKERAQALKGSDKNSIESRVDDLMLAASQQHAELMAKIEQARGDDDPSSFILAPDGSEDFGEITSEQAEKIGEKSGKIRLQQGFHNNDGRGYGKIHIDRELRKDQLKANGYNSTEELVGDVAKNYNAIYEGKGDSYILAKLNGKAKIAYVLVKKGNDGVFYSIGSGLVTRDSYLKNKPLLWERAQTNQLKESPSAVTGKSNGPNKTIPQSPKNATDKDSQTEDASNPEKTNKSITLDNTGAKIMTLSIMESRAISKQIRENLSSLNGGVASIIESRKLSKAINDDLALLNGGHTASEETNDTDLVPDGKDNEVKQADPVHYSIGDVVSIKNKSYKILNVIEKSDRSSLVVKLVNGIKQSTVVAFNNGNFSVLVDLPNDFYIPDDNEDQQADPVAIANINAASISETLKKKAIKYLQENPESHEIKGLSAKSLNVIIENIRSALFAEVKALSPLFTEVSDTNLSLKTPSGYLNLAVYKQKGFVTGYKVDFYGGNENYTNNLFDSTSTIAELSEWGFSLPFDLDVKAFVANVIKPEVDKLLSQKEIKNEPETESESVQIPSDSDVVIAPESEGSSEVDSQSEEQAEEDEPMEDFEPITPEVVEPTPTITGNTEIDGYKSKLLGLQQRQDRMKAVNKIVNNKKLTSEQKKSALGDAGYASEQYMVDAKPKWSDGKLGYEGYQLTNNNANISSTKKRITQLEAQDLAAAKANSGDSQTSYDFDGGTIELDYSADRLKVDFDTKPDSDMISKMKWNGFKWSPSNSVWQRQLTDNAISTANYLFGTKIKTAATMMTEEENKPRPNPIIPAIEPVIEPITPIEPVQNETAEIETEIESLKSETDYKIFDKRLDDLAEKIENAGLMDEYEPILNDVADILTTLLAKAEQED